MVSKKTMLKKIITRVRKNFVMPKVFSTPKERTDLEPIDTEIVMLKLIKGIMEQKLRQSGNRTGKKRNRLLKRTKKLKSLDYRD